MATLLVLVAFWGGAFAAASPPERVVYNPVTGRSEFERQPGGGAPPVQPPVRIGDASRGTRRVAPASHAEPCGCGDIGCADCTYSADSCGDLCVDPMGCGATVAPCASAGAYAGFEFTFVKPRFSDNVAFTTTESDGAGSDTLGDTPIDYDLELTPRVFVGWRRPQGVGFRATWWRFDHAAAALSTSPPANGFGLVDHPDFDGFDGVDLSSSDPTDSFSVASRLDAYAVDLEATHDSRLGAWEVGVGGGLRYASATQGYQAELRNSAGDLQGQIDYQQSIEGFGPTISLSALRPVTHRAALFVRGRGSLLFGDGESRLAAGEDLDLTTPFTTTRTTGRDDVLSIAEVQLGLKWRGDRFAHGPHRPFFTAALEGQVWNGAGTPTSEDGTLGFFGFATAVGLDW
ncbi:Lpg1974 family pore-forming outer membrane protein [Botrimarina sp.]|uniref:Lpg1974 family pore-forming outer membrane protein n=1 Tax=Botrimarina sp. TaxID=2795802 RepID=UPI0032EC8CD0